MPIKKFWIEVKRKGDPKPYTARFHTKTGRDNAWELLDNAQDLEYRMRGEDR